MARYRTADEAASAARRGGMFRYNSLLELHSLVRKTLDDLQGQPLPLSGRALEESALPAIAARLADELNRFAQEHPDDYLPLIDAHDLDVSFDRDARRLLVIPAQRAPAWIHFAWRRFGDDTRHCG